MRSSGTASMQRLGGTASLVVVAALGCGESSPPPPRAFDATEWRSASSVERGAMVADLLDSDRMEYGMPRDEVVELLGAPDSEYEYLTYWLGAPSDRPGRFRVFFQRGKVDDFDRDALPMGERPAARSFDRDAWLSRTGDTRLAMLDAVLAQEAVFRGLRADDVESAFGPADEQVHAVEYIFGEMTECWIGCPIARLLVVHFDAYGQLVGSFEYTAY